MIWVGVGFSLISFRLLVYPHPCHTWELRMDTDKWKSIAVGIETWKKLNELAKENFRTVGGTITYLTEKEYESRKNSLTRRYNTLNYTLQLTAEGHKL